MCQVDARHSADTIFTPYNSDDISSIFLPGEIKSL